MSRPRLRRQIAEAEPSAIVVYPRRHTLVTWIWLYGVSAFIGGLFALGLLMLLIVTPGMREQIGAVLMLILLMGGIGALGAWPMFGLVRFVRSGEPILVINHAGISVRGIYTSTVIFLSWEEVQEIHTVPGTSYALFSVLTVDGTVFSAQLRPLARLARRLNLLSEHLVLSQGVLNQPIEEILREIQTRYKKELQLHKQRQPAAEIPRAEIGERKLVLYTSRWNLLVTAFFLVMALLPGLILIFIGPWQLSGILISLLFLVGSSTVGSTLAWKILRVPVLVVDEEGIASPRFLKRAKLKWEEMDAVYCGIGDRNLTVDASSSGIVSFLTRQNKGRMIIPHHMDITVPQTVFAIPQSMLPLPVPRLLARIKTSFQDQLEYYKIATDMDES